VKNIIETMNFLPSEATAGLEREILLVAHNIEGQKYNLAMSREVVTLLLNTLPDDHRIKQYLREGWLIVPEYSVSLIEVVSPPVGIAFFHQLTDRLESIQQDFSLIIQDKIAAHYPQLSSYYFSIETHGTSEVNEYLLPTGEIVSDLSLNPNDFLLEEDSEFANQVNGHVLRIGEQSEPGVGIYNHLGSTHVTFHPEYRADNSKNIDKYTHFLFHLEKLILSYKTFDVGNRKLLRNGVSYTSPENIRDLFLKSMLEFRYKLSLPIAYQAAANIYQEIENLNALVEQIAVVHEKDADLVDNADEIFRSWSSVNYRPRLTKDKTPLIEVRAFGSNFDLQVLNVFIQHMSLLDKKFEN